MTNSLTTWYKVSQEQLTVAHFNIHENSLEELYRVYPHTSIAGQGLNSCF